MRRMWFWIKLNWQSASRKLKMAVCRVNGKIIILSFNFSRNFFQRHCVVVQSQERCAIFSPKDLQKEQNNVVESSNTSPNTSFLFI